MTLPSIAKPPPSTSPSPTRGCGCFGIRSERRLFEERHLISRGPASGPSGPERSSCDCGRSRGARPGRYRAAGDRVGPRDSSGRRLRQSASPQARGGSRCTYPQPLTRSSTAAVVFAARLGRDRATARPRDRRRWMAGARKLPRACSLRSRWLRSAPVVSRLGRGAGCAPGKSRSFGPRERIGRAACVSDRAHRWGMTLANDPSPPHLRRTPFRMTATGCRSGRLCAAPTGRAHSP